MYDPKDPINIWLEKSFGKDDAYSRPNFRLICNDSKTVEKQRGNFDIVYGTIIVAEMKNTEAFVEKYDYIPEGTWILEKLEFYPEIQLPDVNSPVGSSTGIYELAWAFRDKNGNVLPKPPQRILETFFNSLLFGARIKKNAAMVDAEDKEKFNKEVAFFKMYLENESPYLASQIGRGEAASFSGLDAVSKIKEEIKN